MRTSYRKEDVIFLLKDITGLVQPQSAGERERLIQSGRHYCEMLPVEYVPTAEYMRVYQEALAHFSDVTAKAVGNLADAVIRQRGREVVLVSLARAGTPVGILVKRYLKYKYHTEVPHFSISIIRGKGIDRNAIKFLLERYRPEQLLFVDGWVGKGAIFNELKGAMQEYPGVSPELAVLADPANLTDLCGTHEDILIPSSCLNCTVSGLVSRTFLRSDIIGEDDFHGAVYYGELQSEDLSYAFIDAIVEKFCLEDAPDKEQKDVLKGTGAVSGMEEVLGIKEKYGIADINFIKPGIGETTRVLLRRVPWKILVDGRYRDSRELAHVIRLAAEKKVGVETCHLEHYKCCGIIKKMADV